MPDRPCHYTSPRGQLVQDNSTIIRPMTDSPPDPSGLSTLEWAILRQLQATGGACPALTALPLPGNRSMRRRSQACQTLQVQGWIDCAVEIAQFGLTLTGKTLLGLDLSVWPVTTDEKLILRSGLGGRIGPGQIHRRVSPGDRQRLLHGLVDQGLIVVYKYAITNLQLTPSGQTWLSRPGADTAGLPKSPDLRRSQPNLRHH